MRKHFHLKVTLPPEHPPELPEDRPARPPEQLHLQPSHCTTNINSTTSDGSTTTARRRALRAMGLMTRWPPRAPGNVPLALMPIQQVDTSIARVEHL